MESKHESCLDKNNIKECLICDKCNKNNNILNKPTEVSISDNNSFKNQKQKDLYIYAKINNNIITKIKLNLKFSIILSISSFIISIIIFIYFSSIKRLINKFQKEKRKLSIPSVEFSLKLNSYGFYSGYKNLTYYLYRPYPDKIIILNENNVTGNQSYTSNYINVTNRIYISNVNDTIKLIYYLNGNETLDCSKMFYNCDIKEINITGNNNPIITSMYQMFKYCASLTNILINFDFSHIRSFEEVFFHCNNLKYINMNNSKINNDSVLTSNPFKDIAHDAVICTEKADDNLLYHYIKNSFGLYLDCSGNWKNKRTKKLEESNIYVEKCNISNIYDIYNDVNFTSQISYYNLTFPYLYEYNDTCYNKCPLGTYILNDNKYLCTDNFYLSIDYYQQKYDIKCKPQDFFIDECSPNITYKDKNLDFINYILDEIEKGSFKPLFDECIKENKSFINKENNITYQISTNKGQYLTNLSTIYLDDIELDLKIKYGIDLNEPLLLLKIEYSIEGINIPMIEYSLFTKDGLKLNLSLCDKISTIFSIPVSINENQEFIHNPQSNFYQDKCTTFTSKYNTDITIYDRKNDYNENYLSLCENNCEYKRYDEINKRVECECDIKKEFPYLMKFEIDKKKLLNNFINFKQNSNFFVIVCYKLLFTKEGLLNNIGSYLIILFIIFTIIGFIFFIKMGYNIYKTKIYGTLFQGLININTDYKNNTSNYDKENDTSNEIDTNKSNKIIYNRNLSRNYFFFNKDKNYNQGKINNEEKEKEKKKKKPFMDNDYEINNLDYKDALEYDKRTFFEYYFSLIRMNHIIVFTFYTKTDYNSQIIKYCFFFFSFCLFYTVNALFFTDATMHKIYEDKGAFNFIYQIPNMIYSTIISTLIKLILNQIISTEKKVVQIKNIKVTENSMKEAKIFIKNFKIKSIIFFSLVIFFLLLFWYYLASFGAVYKNTQIILIKDTLISFATSFIYPFFIEIIPCSLRISALRAKKKNYNCLYKISLLFQLL